jgi:hypothetical protein
MSIEIITHPTDEFTAYHAEMITDDTIICVRASRISDVRDEISLGLNRAGSSCTFQVSAETAEILAHDLLSAAAAVAKDEKDTA